MRISDWSSDVCSSDPDKSPRMHPNRRFAIAVLLMAAVSASAIAQSGLTDCRAINDPSARLACYDQFDAGTETPGADGENAAKVAPAARALSPAERTHPPIPHHPDRKNAQKGK